MPDTPTETHRPPAHTVLSHNGEVLPLPASDVRRKRPPLLSFLLRLETLRRAVRVVALLALDFAGLFGAIYAALMLKAVLREGEWAWHASRVETSARSGPACRGSSPRSSRSRSWC